MIHSTNVLQEKNRSMLIKLLCRIMFDFGLFLMGIVVIFSIIGVACVGVGAYVVLRNDSQKREIKRKWKRMESAIED